MQKMQLVLFHRAAISQVRTPLQWIIPHRCNASAHGARPYRESRGLARSTGRWRVVGEGHGRVVVVVEGSGDPRHQRHMGCVVLHLA